MNDLLDRKLPAHQETTRRTALGGLGLLAALLLAGTGTPACQDAEPSEEVKADMMKRWNDIASRPDRTFEFAGRQAGNVVWKAFNEFPHPTYRGGSAEAYRTFATVLADFLEATDNFDFLDRHRLFDHPLRYDLPASPSDPTTFVEMAELLSSDDHFANVPAPVRTSLKVSLEKIRKR